MPTGVRQREWPPRPPSRQEGGAQEHPRPPEVRGQCHEPEPKPESSGARQAPNAFWLAGTVSSQAVFMAVFHFPERFSDRFPCVDDCLLIFGRLINMRLINDFDF